MEYMKRSSLFCGFCQKTEESETTGPLLKKNNVVAHDNCMFFSSGLYCPNTPEDDDLGGFQEQDVIQELRRGSKLRCHLCKKSGATVGCDMKKCRRSYHYCCAMLDNAQNVENHKDGIFKIYCELHCRTVDGDKDANQADSDDEVPAKRIRSPLKRHAGEGLRRRSRSGACIILDSDESDSDGRNGPTLNSELAPVESDLEEDASSGQNIMTGLGYKGNCTDEAQPSTSGKQLPTPNVENDDDTDIVSAKDSQTILPNKIENVVSVFHSGSASSSGLFETLGLASQFWSDCHEAGCVASIFSTFTSAMTEISERILSKQASEEDCELSFKVLKASGMLPEILLKQKGDSEESLRSLQKQMNALKKAINVAISSETS